MRAPNPCAAAVTAVGLLLSVFLGQARATTILVYHCFNARSSMSMSVAAFEAQLNYLDQAGYTVISVDSLARCLDARKNPPDKSVVIAIDDGWSSVMKVVPLLVRRKLPFTLFLPMAYMANPASSATLSRADIDALKAYPKVTFANHSWKHSARVAGNAALAREDIRKSRERYRQLFGHETPYFAYPYGRVSPTYTRLLREAGFKYLFVTGYQPVSAATDPLAIPRIAANRLSLTVLASVLRDQEAMLARVKPRSAPPQAGLPQEHLLLSESRPARFVPRLLE